MLQTDLQQILVADDRTLGYLTGHKANSMERVGAILIKNNGEIYSYMNELFRFPEIEGIVSRRYRDGEDVYQQIADDMSPGKTGFDDNWECRHVIEILKRKESLVPELGGFAVTAARCIKDEKEKDLLRKASQINDRAIAFGIESICEESTELELADSIEAFFCENGGVNVGQYQVVCYGANAADPHHEPDKSKLKPGDPVLIDLVGLIDGYWCDMTRMVFYKEVSEENRRVYEIVKRAQQAGLDFIKPGVKLGEVDRAVRKVIEDAGYGEYFITRTGHGIGLSVHEEPMCAPGSEEVCREGMCFSVEPGIYIPGETGVRIEDLVIVTEDGCEVLTNYPKDLKIIY